MESADNGIGGETLADALAMESPEFVFHRFVLDCLLRFVPSADLRRCSQHRLSSSSGPGREDYCLAA
jgi:hypothetical protein